MERVPDHRVYGPKVRVASSKRSVNLCWQKAGSLSYPEAREEDEPPEQFKICTGRLEEEAPDGT